MKLTSRQLKMIHEALYLRHAMAVNSPIIMTPVVQETMELMNVIGSEFIVTQNEEQKEQSSESKRQN